MMANPNPKAKGGLKVSYMRHPLLRAEGGWTNEICNGLASRGGEVNEKQVLRKRMKQPGSAVIYPVMEWDPVNKKILGTHLQLRNFRWEAELQASTLFNIGDIPGTAQASSQDRIDLFLKVDMDQFTFPGQGQAQHASLWREPADNSEWHFR